MRLMLLSVSLMFSLLHRRRTRSLTICLRVEMTYSMMDRFRSESGLAGRLVSTRVSREGGNKRRERRESRRSVQTASEDGCV